MPEVLGGNIDDCQCDRACLALASTLNLPALTADKACSNLDAGVSVQLIR
jgi:PIN domain nuclease of toxin-antitoxin system